MKVFFNFLNRSFIFTYIILLYYIYLTNFKYTSVEHFFYLFTIPLYYYLAIFIIELALLPLIFFKWIKFIFIFVKSLFDFYLILDILVLKTYSFHIDPLFINMFIHDFKGLGVSYITVAIIALVFISVYLINFYIFKFSKRGSFKKAFFVFCSFLVLLALNQIIHIWANYYNKNYITRFTPFFPYYYPTTSTKKVSKLEKKYPFIKPKDIGKHKAKIKKNVNVDRFKYPKKELKFKKNIKKYNILYIVLESWQSSYMNQETTPSIYTFSKESYYFKNHFSSGNVTTKGLFGLMYGLYATQNYKAVLSNPLKYQTEFTKSLKSLGYDIGLYTTSDFTRFSLKDIFFGKDCKNINMPLNMSIIDGDNYITGKIAKDIKNNKKPWFKFVFLTSSHFNFHYPKKYEIFKPIQKNTSTYIINKNVDPTPYKNRYKNSLYYSDMLVSKILDTVKVKLKDTIVVITADHAEEFAENGAWGHGSRYDKYQLQVPLIIHFPSMKGRVIDKRSFHIDVLPTIFNFIGIENKTSDYSNGVNLLSNYENNRDMVISNYVSKAYIIDDNVVSVGLFTKIYNLYNAQKSPLKDFKRLKELKQKEVEFFNMK